MRADEIREDEWQVPTVIQPAKPAAPKIRPAGNPWYEVHSRPRTTEAVAPADEGLPVIRPASNQQDSPPAEIRQSSSDEPAATALPSASAERVTPANIETDAEVQNDGFEAPERVIPKLRSGSDVWYEIQSRRPQELPKTASQQPQQEGFELPMPAEAAVPREAVEETVSQDEAALDEPTADGFESPQVESLDISRTAEAPRIGGIGPAPTTMPEPEFQYTQAPVEPRGGGTYSEPARSPDQLKRVTEISPFYDYEPDPTIRADDPCRNLCPRPDGAPCKSYEEGESAPTCPEQVGLGQNDYQERELAPSTFAWAASNLYHRPLYFEDPALERDGHTHGCLLQPFVSTGRFSAQLLGLPYQMAIDPMCKKQYTLGWYRPGECAPKLCYQVPWNTHAAAVQAGVMTGLFYAFP